MNKFVVFPDTNQRSIYRNIYIPSSQKINQKIELEKKISTEKLKKLHELFTKSETFQIKYHQHRNSQVNNRILFTYR